MIILYPVIGPDLEAPLDLIPGMLGVHFDTKNVRSLISSYQAVTAAIQAVAAVLQAVTAASCHSCHAREKEVYYLGTLLFIELSASQTGLVFADTNHEF